MPLGGGAASLATQRHCYVHTQGLDDSHPPTSRFAGRVRAQAVAPPPPPSGDSSAPKPPPTDNHPPSSDARRTWRAGAGRERPTKAARARKQPGGGRRRFAPIRPSAQVRRESHPGRLRGMAPLPVTTDDDVALCRARGGELPDDVLAELAALESGAAPVPAPPLAWEPPSAFLAVKAWVAARGMRPGAHPSPPPSSLGEDFSRYARGEGWALDSLAKGQLGRHLRTLGFRPFCRGSRRGVRVDRDSAAVLWAASGLASTPKARPKRFVPRRPTYQRPAAPLFHEVLKDGRRSRARPLVDTLGRVWPTARIAASLLPRVSHGDIQAAAKGKRKGTGGCLWRYLTPDEVARIPPMHRAGHVLPAMAWAGTHGGTRDAVRGEACPACGAARQVALPHPLPPGFPPTPG